MLFNSEVSVDKCLEFVTSDRKGEDRLMYEVVDYAVMHRLRHLAEVLPGVSLDSLWLTPWLTL